MNALFGAEGYVFTPDRPLRDQEARMVRATDGLWGGPTELQLAVKNVLAEPDVIRRLCQHLVVESCRHSLQPGFTADQSQVRGAGAQVFLALLDLEIGVTANGFRKAWESLPDVLRLALAQARSPDAAHGERPRTPDRIAPGTEVFVIELPPITRVVTAETPRPVEEITLDSRFLYDVSFPPQGDETNPASLVLSDLARLLEVGAKLLSVYENEDEAGLRCEMSVRQWLGMDWDPEGLEDVLWGNGFQLGDISARIDELIDEYNAEACDSTP
jgi:hypothetical protein